jgi:hypothetical protein
MRRATLKIAAELPVGHPTRRKLLAALRHEGSYNDFVPPPTLNWPHIQKMFTKAHSKWAEGIREYQEVMGLIEAAAKRAGPDYRQVQELAKRGQNTARQLREQRSAIQDDLFMMQDSMPVLDD